MTKEIHSRESDGVSVTLFADFELNPFTGKSDCVEISCHVVDSRNGDDFTIRDIPKDRVLDVFNHPFSVGRNLLMSGRI